MRVILMNKNTEVLEAEYNPGTKGFSRIIKVIKIEYAPLILKRYYDSEDDYHFRIKLSDWFKGRGIPSWRDKLDLLLHRLNIDTPTELLDKAFGLSLSDQYWLKPADQDIKYDDINFFDHDFDYSEFMDASLSLNSPIIEREESLKTPNNTTDGMLKKAWIIEDGKRYLLKGGYKNEVLQPFNEVLASMICDRLGFTHVPYTLDVVKDISDIAKDIKELITEHRKVLYNRLDSYKTICLGYLLNKYGKKSFDEIIKEYYLEV